MEAIANTSKVLMSDVLKGNVQEVDDEQNIDDLKNRFMTGVLIVQNPVDFNSLVGSISTCLFDTHYEFEIRVIMEDAFLAMKHWLTVKFTSMEIHYNEDVITVDGILSISAIRIQEIDPGRQTCVLAMKLLKE